MQNAKVQNAKVQNAKVYVIDDDPAMRDSLDFLLGSAGFSVRLFESAQMFLNELPDLAAGCVVTDVRMPGIDGMELLRQLNPASGARKLPVIVMTGHGDVPLAVEAMKLGALDFLEKPFEDDRLIGMIETALSHSDSGAKSEAVSADMAARVASLTQRERQVMQGLVTGQSNKAIARDYDISPRTVEVYRANVMTKMQAGNLSELVRFAIRAGIVED
jgi:two-component system response regulator FixJ